MLRLSLLLLLLTLSAATVPAQVSGTPTPIITPTSTPTPPPEPEAFQVLQRPIQRGGTLVDWIDRTYPYGGTQFGEREVHTGVEFVNPRGTSVLAAEDGLVVHAGTDAERLFGPRHNYYGRLVVLEHALSTPEGEPVFTLYGHLERIDVETGERVRAGQPLGTVGDSGIAIGPHLHFEVRTRHPQSFYHTRNPELWLRPYRGYGTLAGSVTNAEGRRLRGVILLVRGVTYEDITRETYTYGSDRVPGDPNWDENFTLGDLPAGDYEVIISDGFGNARFRETVTIRAGDITWLHIELGS